MSPALDHDSPNRGEVDTQNLHPVNLHPFEEVDYVDKCLERKEEPVQQLEECTPGRISPVGTGVIEHSHAEVLASIDADETDPHRQLMTDVGDELHDAFERAEQASIRKKMNEEARHKFSCSHDPGDVLSDLDNDKTPINVPLKIIDSFPKPYESGVEEVEVRREQKLPLVPISEPPRDQESTDLVGQPRSSECAIWMPQPTMEIPNEGFVHIPCFTSDEFSDLEPQRWLVPEVLPAASLVLWWGAPQSGKTALLIDLMFSVAFGEPWHEKR
jgi:hypothetical protein